MNDAASTSNGLKYFRYDRDVETLETGCTIQCHRILSRGHTVYENRMANNQNTVGNLSDIGDVITQRRSRSIGRETNLGGVVSVVFSGEKGERGRKGLARFPTIDSIPFAEQKLSY